VTTEFFILAAAMLIAALAFVLPPLLRSTANPVGAVRRKLRALEQAHADGILDASEYAAKRAALGEALLASTTAPSAPPRTQLFVALALALLLPAGAIVMYRVVGAPQALAPLASTSTAAAAANAATVPPGHDQDMDKAIASLVDKLKQNPSDAGGWALLGRAYRATQRFDEARDALKRANELAPDDPDVLVEYAEALALANPQHSIAGAPRALLDKALKIDPQNQHGLWLSGIADTQAKNYPAAIATWNRLVSLLPKDSDVLASVKRQIAQAEALRDGRPPLPDEDAAPEETATATASAPAPAANAPVDSAGGPRITVSVALDPKLKGKVDAADVLYVFAKAASGPPMPLAIARMKASDLPTTVTLTDGMGMLPSMKLSQFPQVIVGARISKSGNAIAQSGDLQTLSPPLPSTRSEPLTLTIDQVVQ
jgi:cytochrome c-type biogenesis protein CcmH